MTHPASASGSLFLPIFDANFAPKLGQREEGFRTIFEGLRFHTDLVIVETGCLRALENWSGDGQSTLMFDTLIKVVGGQCFSIDNNVESLRLARRLCREVQLILGDGKYAIHDLVRQNGLDRIDLLYLDSFDARRDVSVIPAPVHYALELCAAWPALKVGSIIAIDDFRAPEVPGERAGTKGMAVDMMMTAVHATVLYDGYQKVWQL